MSSREAWEVCGEAPRDTQTPDSWGWGFDIHDDLYYLPLALGTLTCHLERRGRYAEKLPVTLKHQILGVNEDLYHLPLALGTLKCHLKRRGRYAEKLPVTLKHQILGVNDDLYYLPLALGTLKCHLKRRGRYAENLPVTPKRQILGSGGSICIICRLLWTHRRVTSKGVGGTRRSSL